MSEEQKIPPVMRQGVVPLSGGWYMVRHVTKSMCELMWSKMDEFQRDELRALYDGDDSHVKDGMWCECNKSGHQAAFFDGPNLVCIMWAEWTTVRGITEKLRVLGCFCNSEYAREHIMSFVKKTPECRDAFELDEPPAVTELYVFIAKGYNKSRKWAVMFGGMEKAFDAHSKEHPFICYKRPIGGM